MPGIFNYGTGNAANVLKADVRLISIPDSLRLVEFYFINKLLLNWGAQKFVSES